MIGRCHLPREGDGRQPDRRELNRILGKLAPGDVVTVTWIDRLARSTRTAKGRRPEPRQGPREAHGPPPSLNTPAQQPNRKEALRRRAQGATLEELARRYNVSRATISRLPVRGQCQYYAPIG
jgi:DNA invertase Pin-like site-specific DNA recombinase